MVTTEKQTLVVPGFLVSISIWILDLIDHCQKFVIFLKTSIFDISMHGLHEDFELKFQDQIENLHSWSPFLYEGSELVRSY